MRDEDGGKEEEIEKGIKEEGMLDDITIYWLNQDSHKLDIPCVKIRNKCH